MGASRRFRQAERAARSQADLSAADARVPHDGASSRASDAVRGAVRQALTDALPWGGRVAVALSGGRDSTALLDATIAVSASARCAVAALHVHHGLSPNADAWWRFCEALCAAHGVAFAMRRVEIRRTARTSTEAQARTQRYAALTELARAEHAGAVLLAHHADDQAETVLLQLLRGSGPAGLAAMPPARYEHGLWWLRPFLGISRAQLHAYAAERGLRFVDDDSNADPRYRRNALRSQVVPALRALAPGYPVTLARAARHQAEATTLLDEIAQADARSFVADGTLDAAALRSLASARARNLLRWFLAMHGLCAPSSARVAEMLRQFAHAAPDSRAALAHDGAHIAIHRGRVRVHRPPPAPFACAWAGEPAVELPHGTLVFTATQGTGIAARHAASQPVTIRSALRGERLLVAGGHHRAVSDLLREAGVPRWDRPALPRVYCGHALAAVVHAGVDAGFAAADDEPAFALEWHPREAR